MSAQMAKLKKRDVFKKILPLSLEFLALLVIIASSEIGYNIIKLKYEIPEIAKNEYNFRGFFFFFRI